MKVRFDDGTFCETDDLTAEQYFSNPAEIDARENVRLALEWSAWERETLVRKAVERENEERKRRSA